MEAAFSRYDFIIAVFRTHVQRVQQTAFAECCRQFFDAFLLVSRARIVRTCPELRNIHQHGRKRLRRVVHRGLYGSIGRCVVLGDFFAVFYVFRFHNAVSDFVIDNVLFAISGYDARFWFR